MGRFGGKIVKFRRNGRWTKASGDAPGGRRGFAFGILAGAVIVGIGGGALLNLVDPSAPRDPAEAPKTETFIADYSDEPGDAEWQARALDSPPGAEAPGRANARFGFCHVGGGRNCVVDGDSIWIDGQNVRIADIDAPETHEPRCAAELELGNRATRRLHQLVNGGTVTLQSIGRDSDTYGRKLRIVLVDGQSVGDRLVAEGLARWYEGGRRSWC